MDHTRRVRASQKYTAGLIGAVALTALTAFAINTTVNPWRVTPMPWSSAALEPYRDITSQTRTAKAGLVRSMPKVGAAIVGSSRVANAMDPDYAGWQRPDVVNLGCSGAFLYESTAMARYALEQRQLEVLIFGVDPGDLSSTVDTRPLGDYHASPLVGDEDRFNRELRYYIGISTLEASVETLRNAAEKRLAQYNGKGLRVRAKRPPTWTQLGFLRTRIRGEAQFGGAPDGDAPVQESKAAALEAVMHLARSRGTRMVVYFHPLHALYFSRAAHAADPPAMLTNERRALVEMVERANARPLPGRRWSCGTSPAIIR